MNLEQLIGLGGAIPIRELVESIKPAWAGSKLSGLYNIGSSIIFGVVLNVALAAGMGNDLRTGLAFGVITGLLAPVWNLFVDVSKG